MPIVKGTAVISSQSGPGEFPVDLPTFVSGNVWIAIFLTRAGNQVQAPTGWTQAANLVPPGASSGNRPRVTVFTRVPDGSDGASAEFFGDWEFGGPMLAAVYPMSGVDTNNILASDFTFNHGTAEGPVTNAPITNPGTVTNFTDSFLFNIQAANLQNNPWTEVTLATPNGWTNDVNTNPPQAFSANNFIQVNYKTQTTIDHTGAANGSLSTTADSPLIWGSIVFALKDVDGEANQPPTVDVGPDRSTHLGVPISLTATANDPEGQPLTYLWEKISGPVGGTIVSPTNATTEIRDLFEGTYVFRCTATDTGDLSGNDQLTVTVGAVDYRTAYLFTESAWQRRRVRVYQNGSWQ